MLLIDKNIADINTIIIILLIEMFLIYPFNNLTVLFPPAADPL